MIMAKNDTTQLRPEQQRTTCMPSFDHHHYNAAADGDHPSLLHRHPQQHHYLITISSV